MTESITKKNGLGVVRELEPFAFWPQYSSAIHGWGGDDRGPDPYYCFHTPYTTFEPGTVLYRVDLFEAKATMGELALRVHAFRPNAAMDAVMVAGLRVPLEEVDGDLALSLRIAALPGVVYALYGRFGEASDLRAARIKVQAEELADDDSASYVSGSLEASRFSGGPFPEHTRLLQVREPSLKAPVSQPMTSAQMRENIWRELPAVLSMPTDASERWRQAFAYQTLRGCGMTLPGATGLILGGHAQALVSALSEEGCVAAEAAGSSTHGAFDFVVAHVARRADLEAKAFDDAILENVKYMLRGGIGVFIFPISMAASSENGVSHGRQSVQRIALRLIGHGCDVAPLCFPPEVDSNGEDVLFGMTIRR